MMDKISKEKFEEITNKDINDLSKEDVAFLRARRSYLTPSQKLAYTDLNLFKDDVKANQVVDTKVESKSVTPINKK